MALSLLSSRSLAHLAYSAAPRLCCSALPRVRALFVEAHRARSAKNTQLSPAAPSKDATKTAQICTHAAAQPVGLLHNPSIYPGINIFKLHTYSRMEEVLRPLQQQLETPSSSSLDHDHIGAMPLEDGIIILIGKLLKGVQRCIEGYGPSDNANSHPGYYLGNIQQLIDHAKKQKGGKLTPGQVRTWLLDPQNANIVKAHGIDPEELVKYDIDHVLPAAKGGFNHPCNYYLMVNDINKSFGAKLNLTKCLYVGLDVTWAVLMFHAKPLLPEDQLELMESRWDWQALLQ